MSKDAKSTTGLVQAARNSLAAGAPAGGAVVDMQDLMPVIQSFQDHMAAEQTRQRERIRGLVTLFILALVVAMAYPLWVVRGLFRDQHKVLEAQQAVQAQAARTLEKALHEVAEPSRALREELTRMRATTTMAEAAGPAPAPEPAAAPAPVAATPDAVPAPVAAPPTEAVKAAVVPAEPPNVEPAPVAPAEPAAAPVAVKPDEAANRAVAGEGASVRTNGAAPVVQTDLEKLLRQVEQSIAEKQRQLQKKQTP